MYIHLTLSSRNAKTGPIPVSTSSMESCPSACPFNSVNAGGCYAESGPLAIHWRKVTSGASGNAFSAFLSQVRSLPDSQLWRHNQAGDLAGRGDSLDIEALAQLVEANKGRRGFTYTHKPLASQEERDAIKSANDNGFAVNLSANNLDHADSLYGLGIAPVVVVLPKGARESVTTPKGRKVIVCPAAIRDDVTCASCGICAKMRKAIVGFPAHGAGAKRAEKVASGN